VVTYEYNPLGQTTEVSSNDGPTVTYTYTDCLLTEVAVGSNTTTYGYDSLGRVVSITDALDHETTYDIDRSGRLLQVTDAEAGETAFVYDEYNNLIQVTDARDHSTWYAYDASNRVISVTDEASNVTTYEYGAAGCSCCGRRERACDGRVASSFYPFAPLRFHPGGELFRNGRPACLNTI